MTVRHEQADTATLATLSADVARCDAHVASEQGVLSELRGRRAKLQSTIARHDRTRPPETVEPDVNVVRAMAGDPGATIDAATRKKVQEQQARHAEKVAAWSADQAILSAGMAQLDTEIGDSEARLRSEQSAREHAWWAFTSAARAYLTEEFRASWSVLRTNILEPLTALAGGNVPLKIVNGALFMEKDAYRDGHSRCELFPLRASAGERESHVGRFRQALAAGQVVPIDTADVVLSDWREQPRCSFDYQRNGSMRVGETDRLYARPEEN